MKLKRIELTNYRQHAAFDVDFEGNMIAVLGPNGSGKSNLLGAIQFALTGEQPPFEKKDLTKWGEKEGSVKLVFLAGSDNKEFVIVRKTNGDVTLSIDGGEKVKGAKKVAEVLKDIAGLDKELLRQVVFVPQKGIDAILFDDPKAREVAFQRLIGIGEASKIYEALRTEIQAYDKPSAFNEAIAKARQQLEDANKSVDMCAEKMGKYEEAIAQLPSVEDLNNEAADALRAQTAVDEYIAVRKDLAQAMSENEALIAGAHHDVGRADPPSPGEEEALREKLNDLATQIAYVKRLDELANEAKCTADKWAEMKQELDSIVQSNPDIENERMRLASLRERATSLGAELRHLKSLSSEDSATGECPLCGSHVKPGDIAKHVKDKIAELEADLKKVTDESQPLSGKISDYDMATSGLSARLGQASAVKKRAFEALSAAKDKGVDGVEIDLHTFAVSYKGKTLNDIADLDKERIAAKNRLDAIAKLAKDEADYVAKLNKVSARIDVLKGREKAALEKLTEARIDASNPEELSAKLAKKHSAAISNRNALEGILRDAAEEKGKHKMLLETIERTKASLCDLEAKQKLDDQLREKVEVLKRAREWFNFREGPRIMSQNVMRDLCGYVNDFLDQFCAPFVVEAEEEGFGFRCRFIDGRQMPDPCPDASLLSGGQKVMLAIAFRMAIYMRFGGELGLLSLDEPTAYLDDAAIEHLGDLLVKVGQIARNKGLQMLMATHEKAIMGFMDTKIEVGAKQ